MPRVLLVDDDPIITNSLSVHLRHKGYAVQVTHTCAEAARSAAAFQPDAIILDLEMPDRDGLDLLPQLKAVCPYAEIIVYTGTGDVEKAVRATKLGAYDFIEKEPDEQRVLHSLRNALVVHRLRDENARLRQVYDTHVGTGPILVFSEKTRRVFQLAERYRATPGVAVLIQGESGTGKELVARHIHHQEDGASRPFVAINCGAIPRELVESELFGYTPGAFTGARSTGAPGKIQAAEGGTLFLDEIGDLDLNSQVKFLRFLEHGSFYPVGGTEERRVRVRVVCASNRDLEAAIAAGQFRRDLYYRINVGEIRIPPLRERREEILPFAYHFLAEFSERFQNPFEQIHPAAEQLLQSAPWEGNVRELRHLIERIVLTEEGPVLLPEHVAFLAEDRHQAERGASESEPAYAARMRAQARRARHGAHEAPSRQAPPPSPAEAPLPEEGLDLEQTMLRLIQRALEKNDHNQSRTARYLNITRETLRYRMKKLAP